jgi:DNA-binding CsgD family transcriptional regulator
METIELERMLCMKHDRDKEHASADEPMVALNRKLKEAEIALRVLLEGRERDIAALREEYSGKIKNSVLPYLDNLKRTKMTPEQYEFIEIIEKNVTGFYDRTYEKLSSPTLRLSPTEVKVAQLIRDGKTNKEIARLLHLSKSTILTHRHHIRVKLGLKNKKINLRSFLLN